MEKNTELALPCTECTSLNLSCCANPRIIWTLEELDNLYSDHPEVFKGCAVFKAEVPGTVYILRVNTDDVDKETNSVRIDYCAMYDAANGRCIVYDSRPQVCKSYGDPEYMTCPYTDYREAGALTELKHTNPQLADALHVSAPTNVININRDFIFPWVERFEASAKENPEWMQWWEELPTTNFIRK